MWTLTILRLFSCSERMKEAAAEATLRYCSAGSRRLRCRRRPEDSLADSESTSSLEWRPHQASVSIEIDSCRSVKLMRYADSVGSSDFLIDLTNDLSLRVI